MLKYKNRLTPNIYTLQKLVTFYRKRKTTSLFSVNNFNAFFVILNLKKEKPSFSSIFSNLNLVTPSKWSNIKFKTSLNCLVSQKYFLTTPKLPLFSKKKFVKVVLPSSNYFKAYNDLYATSRPLIGKPFNSQNTYFFKPWKDHQDRPFNHKPFFSRILWKTYFLTRLRDRFTFTGSKIVHSRTRLRLLENGSFGGPVPSTGNLFQKPYLFTNTIQKKPILKNFTLSLLKKPFTFFKKVNRKFLKRRFSWSKTGLNKYNAQTSQYFLLSSFNLLSSMQFKQANKKFSQTTICSKVLRTNYQIPKAYSLHFFLETVKLLAKTKNLKHITKLLDKQMKKDLIRSQNNSLVLTLSLARFWDKKIKKGLIQSRSISSSPTLNLTKKNLSKFRSNSSYTTQLSKSLLEHRKKKFKRSILFKRRLTRKLVLKRLRKRFKMSRTSWKRLKWLKRLNQSLLTSYLVRPRRWGRKFLRRKVLKKSLNLTTFSLILLKRFFIFKNQSRLVSKVNYSIIKKKVLWRKFLKWKKRKKLNKLSVKRKLVFTNFFTKYFKNNFSYPRFSFKLKFRFNLLRRLPYSLKSEITILPKLFTHNCFLKGFEVRSQGFHLLSPLHTSVALSSNYQLTFIFPLYGFLFITSNNLTKGRMTTNQTTLKKTAHSFFYLDDLKSFIVGKHSTILNNYNSFFSPTETLYTDQPLPFDAFGNGSMSNFLTTNFLTVFDEEERVNVFDRVEPDPRISRFKFKPGYSRLWRRARVGIKEYFQIKFQYQHRLTRFLPQFYKLHQVALMKSTELRLDTLLLFSRLLPDSTSCKEFLNAKLVFLNGRTVSCGKVYLVRNDLIQLLISMKYYVLFKWFANWEASKTKRLNRLLYLSRLETKRTFRKKLPDWVLRKISVPYDIPKYVEVDYLTLSAFVLYEPFFANDFTNIFQKFSRSPIYNVYNWKYIT